MGWRSFRGLLQTLHLWVGLALSIPFILIGVSGSLILLIAVVNAHAPPAAPARGEMKPLATILAAAQAATPEGYSVQSAILPGRLGRPAAVQIGVNPGGRPPEGPNLAGTTIYVDPVSLKILGSEPRRRAGFMNRNLHTLHVALMAPGYFGLQFVGFMGVFMLLFGITGLVLWWPKRGQWRFAFSVKRGTRGWRLNHDLHSVFGFWTLIVFMIVSLSGVYLAFPVTFQSMVEAVAPTGTGSFQGKIDDATLATIADRNAVTPDEAIRLALSAVPDSRAVAVQLPPSPDGIYMVTLTPAPYGDGAPQISAFIGPGTEVTDIVDPRAYDIGKRFLVWLRVMHYGQGFGGIWNLLVFLSGLLPLLFAITGYRMWSIKRAQRRTLPQAVVVPAE
jgi:uncharacterized iron-regulated membrane protein